MDLPGAVTGEAFATHLRVSAEDVPAVFHMRASLFAEELRQYQTPDKNLRYHVASLLLWQFAILTILRTFPFMLKTCVSSHISSSKSKKRISEDIR